MGGSGDTTPESFFEDLAFRGAILEPANGTTSHFQGVMHVHTNESVYKSH